MSPLRLKLFPLGLLGLGLAIGIALGTAEARGLVAGGEVSAQEGIRASEEPAPDQPVSDELVPGAEDAGLAELRADPLPWLGRRVRLVVQFQAHVEDWNPWLTRFGPAEWTAFSAWEDERFVWDEEVHSDPLTRLFVRRGSGLEGWIAGAETYQRFEVVARVREVFLDEPWLEVEDLRPLPEHVGEGTILHVGRARDFMSKRQWQLALQQFERAKAAPLPAHALEEVDRQMDLCVELREASAASEPPPR